MRKKIVIVDDNATSLTIAKVMLSQDHDAIPMTSGEQLLELVGEISPDLIFLDIEMPGLNGFEVFDTLQKMAIDVPVVFLSGNQDDSAERAIAAGAAAYIQKPVMKSELLEAVDKYSK